MILLALLACPLLGALALVAARPGRPATVIHLLVAIGTALAALALAVAVALAGVVGVPAWSLRADPLSAFLVVLVAGVQLVAALGAPAYLAAEAAAARIAPERAARFGPLFHLFVWTMLLAVTTDNVGLMWIAVEGTTLASVFLITLERTRASLEAAYKYLLICSVGIAVAFMGTVLVYYANIQQLGESAETLDWSLLVTVAPRLPSGVVALAFVFLLIGYGTKIGLAPMHTWLPDAHSEAPAPVSALMSGVLLAVGLYALLRFKVVVDLAAGPAFARRLLVALGLLSMAVAATSLWAPQNYKRMLAYSSVEHMGLVCLGVAFGGWAGVAGALLHLLNHALAKSALFVLAGRVLQRYGSAEVDRVRGLRQAMPWTGAAFLAATLALLGVPPFGLFVSEVLILRAGFAGGYAWAAALALAALVAVFGGMLRAVNRMLHGACPDEIVAGENGRWPLAPVAVNLLVLLGLGLLFPPALVAVLGTVAGVVGGGG